jgi:hypothetical protein
MTTKPLKRFTYKNKYYYTDGGECYDHQTMNYFLYKDAKGLKPLSEVDMPDEDDFASLADRVSKDFLLERGIWGTM